MLIALILSILILFIFLFVIIKKYKKTCKSHKLEVDHARFISEIEREVILICYACKKSKIKHIILQPGWQNEYNFWENRVLLHAKTLSDEQFYPKYLKKRK